MERWDAGLMAKGQKGGDGSRPPAGGGEKPGPFANEANEANEANGAKVAPSAYCLFTST